METGANPSGSGHRRRATSTTSGSPSGRLESGLGDRMGRPHAICLHSTQGTVDSEGGTGTCLVRKEQQDSPALHSTQGTAESPNRTKEFERAASYIAKPETGEQRDTRCTMKGAAQAPDNGKCSWRLSVLQTSGVSGPGPSARRTRRNRSLPSQRSSEVWQTSE